MTLNLDMIGMVVADMPRSLAFYRELGLELDTVETIRSFFPEWEAPSGNSRVDFAFRCESPADVDATYERLTSQRYEGRKEPWDAFWGQRYAVVDDPDVNGIDLFAPSE